MLNATRASISAAEFEVIAALPENADRRLELVGGEIFDVPSNAYASAIATQIAFFIKKYLFERGIAGYVTGEAGGYQIAGENYAPDVAYISKARQPHLARSNPNPPELAVEVDFPSTLESQKTLRIKTFNYVLVGTVVWVVLPESQSVEVYAAGQPVKILTVNDRLDGGDFLPGFQLPVKDIFAETGLPDGTSPE